MFAKLTRGQWIGASLLLGAALLAVSWRTAVFTSAVVTSDRRPALLEDANWGQSNGGAAFGRRFHAGVLEADLLSWLEANTFIVDRAGHRAERRLAGVPCAEDISVSWSAKDQRISRANAVVTEGGCL